MKIEQSKYYYNQAVFWAKKHDQKIAALVISVLPFICSVIKRYIPKNEWLDAAADGMIDGSYALRNLFIIYLAKNGALSVPKAIILIIASLFLATVERRITIPKSSLSEQDQLKKFITSNESNALLLIDSDAQKKAIIRETARKNNCIMLEVPVSHFIDKASVSEYISSFFEDLRSFALISQKRILIFMENLDTLSIQSKIISIPSPDFQKLMFLREFMSKLNSPENRDKFILIGNLRSNVRYLSSKFAVTIRPNYAIPNQENLRTLRCARFSLKAM